MPTAVIPAIAAMLCGPAGDASPQAPAAVRRAVEADWLRQEQVTWRREADSPTALSGVLERGRRMIADFQRMGAVEAAGEAAGHLAAVRAADPGAGADEKARKARLALYLRARRALRRLAFRSPHLDFSELLLVKRHHPAWGHQCSHRVGEAQRPGADLCVLSPLSPDGKVRSLIAGKLRPGGIGRPDLSFDARRVVFPYAAPRSKPTAYGYGQPGVRGGACVMYDLYEVGVDAAGPRRLTDRADSEDTEPCYLPDGRIAFTSSRDGRFVQCGDWALACGVYAIRPDGSDPRRLTEPKEGEFYPSVLDDGRVLYTRWDYVMKPYNTIQQLWAVSPDGTRPQLVYGDHYAFSRGPIALSEARQIPATSRVLCTGSAHHNTGGGPIMIVDLARHRDGPGGMVCLTPEVGYPEAGMNNRRSPAGWYCSPYPLSERQFLVAYSFEAADSVAGAFALYLQDIHGNKELIYRDAKLSCYSPIPLRPRRRPPILPAGKAAGGSASPGVFLVADVYQGLPGVRRGAVRYLRILETHSKTVRTTPQRCDVGAGCGWDVRGVLGTVPVEPDGSAHFTVPAGRQVFFEAIDADFLEIRRMRNFVNVQPGEVAACVGCHEPPRQAPPTPKSPSPLAARRRPSPIQPPPWGQGGFSFPRIVQPVLDRHCIRCHDGSGAKGKAFDLRGRDRVAAPVWRDRDQGPQHAVSDSFVNLLKHVNYVRVSGYDGGNLPLAPYATGSARSRLMTIHKAGHNGVKLTRDEWRALAAWIDCNAPFYGGWDEIRIGARPPKRADALSALRKPTAADRAAAARRCRELQADLPDGHTLAAYVNCGVQLISDGPGPVKIRQRRGRGWNYTARPIPGVPATQRDIAFDEAEIAYELRGLSAGRHYTVGLTWWDFNTTERRASVWASRLDGGGATRLLEPTALPSHVRRSQLPGRLRLDLPAKLTRSGTARLSIRRAGGANAVICELWIVARPPPAQTPAKVH